MSPCDMSLLSRNSRSRCAMSTMPPKFQPVAYVSSPAYTSLSGASGPGQESPPPQQSCDSLLLWRCFISPFTGFRLRVIEGALKGHWLTGIDVSKGGMPFRTGPSWPEVALHPDEFQINPRFHDDEKAAWSGFTKERAQTFQRIVLSTGIQTEIVEP
jgi:hypothetical protein